MTRHISSNQLRKALAAVHSGFGVPPRHVLGPRRPQEHVGARHALYTLLSLRGYSAKGIAKRLGKRAHGTVTHGINRCWDLCSTDKQYADQFNRAVHDFRSKARQ